MCRMCVRTVFTDRDSSPAISGAERLVGRYRRTRVSLSLSGVVQAVPGQWTLTVVAC